MAEIEKDEETQIKGQQESKEVGTDSSLPTCVAKNTIQHELSRNSSQAEQTPLTGTNNHTVPINPIKSINTTKDFPTFNPIEHKLPVLKTIEKTSEPAPLTLISAGVTHKSFQGLFVKTIDVCTIALMNPKLILGKIHDFCFEKIAQIKTFFLQVKQNISDKFDSICERVKSWFEKAKQLASIRKVRIDTPIDEIGHRKFAFFDRAALGPLKLVGEIKSNNGIQSSLLKNLNDSDDRESSGTIKVFFKIIKNALEQLAEAVSFKREQEKINEKESLAIKQKELEEQTHKSMREANLLRPDLASRFREPQLAFLASSPFAQAPSAQDLIEQAEKEETSLN